MAKAQICFINQKDLEKFEFKMLLLKEYFVPTTILMIFFQK